MQIDVTADLHWYRGSYTTQGGCHIMSLALGIMFNLFFSEPIIKG